VLFDQRKAIPYGTMQGLSDTARRDLVPAWTSGDPTQIGPALEKFLMEFRSLNFSRRASIYDPV